MAVIRAEAFRAWRGLRRFGFEASDIRQEFAIACIGGFHRYFATLFKFGQRRQVVQWAEGAIDRHTLGLGWHAINSQGTHDECLQRARDAIAREITTWLDCWKKTNTGGVSDFVLCWMTGHQRWELQINYHGLLFPAIAFQLALVLADADSLYTCSGCGVPYVRPRERKRPKSGWANYCDQCSKDGVAQRRAVETYREKRAKAARMHSSGASISEIAEQLNAAVARVRGWLEKGGEDAKTKTRKR